MVTLIVGKKERNRSGVAGCAWSAIQKIEYPNKIGAIF